MTSQLTTSQGLTAAVTAGLLGVTSMVLPSRYGDDAALTLTPEAMAFGLVEVGEQSQPEAITATNDSDAPLLVSVVGVGGDSFSMESDSCTGVELEAGDSCTVGVTFAPTDVGELHGSVEFVTASGAERASLSGEGASTTTTATQPTILPTPTPTPSPTTSTTAGTTDTTVSDRERLQDCERRAQDATVSFAPSLEMTVGDTSQFVVVASTGDGDPTTSMESSTTVVPVRLRCEVEGRLRSADFQVDPTDWQPGSFLDSPTITWSWDVIPQKPGQRVLTLEIRSVAIIDGRRIPGAGGTLYTSAIDVVAQPENMWDISKRWSDQVVEHPLIRGLGSLLLLLGTIAGAWRWLLKRPWPWRTSEHADGEIEGDETADEPSGPSRGKPSAGEPDDHRPDPD